MVIMLRQELFLEFVCLKSNFGKSSLVCCLQPFGFQNGEGGLNLSAPTRRKTQRYGLLLFDPFVYVTFKEIASPENTNDGINSGENSRLLFLI